MKRTPLDKNNNSDFFEHSFLKSSLSPDDLSTQELLERQCRYDRTIKRTGDIVFSLLVILVGAPFFILIGLLVKLSSPGPVFYLQERLGRNYMFFGCIKFRTMHPEADSLLENLLAREPSLKAEFEKDFKLRDDPRITPIGRFLRVSSLDELPQFFNVLQGHMSIVGPRPIVLQEVQRYGPYMKEVASVRPGITGLWQVSGRNNLTYRRRVMLDLFYVRKRSFIMDLRIFLRTFGVLLFPRDRGAY
ncbi:MULTISPECIES: sugar transferase [Prochlorococcus]|uniref:Sugar transferase n=1 Tax=Prochlorococcus marinus (strain SARG / CCMP1375 / SS120) TaxID=167539 RepID=Q7VAR6_PROMA|nr:MULTISPECIES: sugar transferase [Prochlorococcus]AAQ00435.1 Sugar transferase [Prochlorococcus marinus subsp. marinus str. CCMP1375]KGG14317.1 Undecaprenyl-phosphate galactosephosphotransferase [Prochlorococcus marinus str. LG]KGG22111.1 Undecaprenyl-phosphate galactosephosphotransferase [Prochlorococcus marinus str. SS2]KGG24572.1 Undecaprenyl-phosphate galactosephosphotransferase [Prochlorococcus marinus str. SS35]KGG33466.1 Undecaprenyl-phosphate galactosephosphotransferase [Prochlorococ